MLRATVVWGQPLAKDGCAPVDSIVSRAITNAVGVQGRVTSYTAGMYLKSTLDVPRKNVLHRLVPNMFHVSKGERSYIVEAFDTLHFVYPQTYDRKTTAMIGSANELFEADGRLSDLFSFNIYSHMLMADKYISPLSQHARRYYRYSLDTVLVKNDKTMFFVSYKPVVVSYQLLDGWLLLDAETLRVVEAEFNGRNEMLRFKNRMVMGESGSAEELLPISFDLHTVFNFLGNKVLGDYVAQMKYGEISFNAKSDSLFGVHSLDEHDLTRYHVLDNDKSEPNQELDFFTENRPFPLSASELEVYNRHIMRTFNKNYVEGAVRDDDYYKELWNQFGDALVSRSRFRVKNLGSFRLSPILDPQKLGYSHRNGVSYSMDLRFTKNLDKSRQLTISPRLGYNFKYKKLYWRLRGSVDLWPAKRSSLRFEAANGNRIYNAQLLQQLKDSQVFGNAEIPNLGYYNDLYATLTHSWEMVNGFALDLGVTVHHRTADRGWLGVYDIWHGNNMPGDGAAAPVYNSFAPRLRLSWTPGQDYYMEGERKINVASASPTFVFDWERGVGGFLHHSLRYDRFELDVTADRNMGFERTLFFRFGAGAFARSKNLYFIDFEHFRRHNLPDGWNDDIGGVFHLLRSYHYNNSRKYLRWHFAYESPFLILPRQISLFKYVMRERVYLSVLDAANLSPYAEIGYGVGTHIFDFGVFASFNKLKYSEIGMKITFELFHR